MSEETNRTYAVTAGSFKRLKETLSEKQIPFRLDGDSVIHFEIHGISFLVTWAPLVITASILHKPWYIGYDAIWSAIDKLVEEETKP